VPIDTSELGLKRQKERVDEFDNAEQTCEVTQHQARAPAAGVMAAPDAIHPREKQYRRPRLSRTGFRRPIGA